MKNIIIMGIDDYTPTILASINPNAFKVVGFLDDQIDKGTIIYQHQVLGTFKDLYCLGLHDASAVFIGCSDIKKRHRALNIIREEHLEMISIIDNNAMLDSKTLIGAGCYIGKGAIINSACELGAASIVGSGTILEYNVILKENVVLGSSCLVANHSQIGADSVIGLRSVLMPNTQIGAHSKIAPNSIIDINVNTASKERK